MRLLFVLIVFLSGCASILYYEPKTPEGAQCKKSCAEKYSTCNQSDQFFFFGSNTYCHEAISVCLESCQDIEDISNNKKLRSSM